MTEIYFKAIFALVCLTIILYVILKLLQKYTHFGDKTLGNKNNLLKINSLIYIDSQTKIVNFSCKNKKYLILVGKNSDLLLDSYEHNENTVK